MARVKISGKFSDARQAVVAHMYLKSVFSTDESVIVGPTEGEVYLPIYCIDLVQSTVHAALEGLNAKDITVVPA